MLFVEKEVSWKGLQRGNFAVWHIVINKYQSVLYRQTSTTVPFVVFPRLGSKKSQLFLAAAVFLRKSETRHLHKEQTDNSR
jgi:hypothetical protein